jgi:hypothetical protein
LPALVHNLVFKANLAFHELPTDIIEISELLKFVGVIERRAVTVSGVE